MMLLTVISKLQISMIDSQFFPAKRGKKFDGYGLTKQQYGMYYR